MYSCKTKLAFPYIGMNKRLSARRRRHNTDNLFLAVESNNVKLVKHLLKKGANVNSTDSGGRLLLHLNANGGSDIITRHLLLNGCRINNVDNLLNTALHEAILCNNNAVARCLIQAGAKVNKRNWDGNTPLHLAILHSANLKIISMMLKRGAKVGILNYEEMSVLHLAITNNNLKVVKLLIAHETEAHSLLTMNDALYFAVAVESVEILQVLLEAGVDVHQTGGIDEDTALHYAAFNNDVEILNLLLNAGIDINHQNNLGFTALHIAIKYGDGETASFLVNRGANIHLKTNLGDTVLHWATMSNVDDSNVNIIRQLLDKSGNLNERNDKGETPLLMYLKNGSYSMVKLFLELGADPTIKDTFGCSALHYAVNNADTEVINLILNSNVDVNGRCALGFTALHSICNHLHCPRSKHIKLLIKRGANVRIRDGIGRIPLYYAISRSSIYDLNSNECNDRNKSISLLLKYGFDANFIMRDGRTILEVAIYKGPVESRMLIRHITRQSVKVELSEHNLNVLERFPECKIFYEACLTEIETMKRLRYDNISCFDLLSRSTNTVAMYTRNENVIEMFEENDYMTWFPIFHLELKKIFNKAMDRRRLKENTAVLLSETMKFFDPSHLVCEKIMQYLTVEDMQKITST